MGGGALKQLRDTANLKLIHVMWDEVIIIIIISDHSSRFDTRHVINTEPATDTSLLCEDGLLRQSSVRLLPVSCLAVTNHTHPVFIHTHT